MKSGGKIGVVKWVLMCRQQLRAINMDRLMCQQQLCAINMDRLRQDIKYVYLNKVWAGIA
jgi:hypothetical protein